MLTDIRDRVLLVKASPEDSGRWFLPGGGVRFGEDPEAGLRREVEEETGFRLARIEPVLTAYMSPGSVTERLHFYVAEVEPEDRVASGGGGL